MWHRIDGQRSAKGQRRLGAEAQCHVPALPRSAEQLPPNRTVMTVFHALFEVIKPTMPQTVQLTLMRQEAAFLS